MLSCLELCKKYKVGCPSENKDCRLWIPSEKHYNCIDDFVRQTSIIEDNRKKPHSKKKNSNIVPTATFRQISDALGITKQAVDQIVQKSLIKLQKKMKKMKLGE